MSYIGRKMKDLGQLGSKKKDILHRVEMKVFLILIFQTCKGESVQLQINLSPLNWH